MEGFAPRARSARASGQCRHPRRLPTQDAGVGARMAEAVAPGRSTFSPL